MKDILDILNPSNFTWDQLGTLDGDASIFESFNDRHTEDALWTDGQENQTQQSFIESNINTTVENTSSSQISSDYDKITNSSINEADFKMYVEGENIRQLLEMDIDSFPNSYESEVLSELPDSLAESNGDNIMVDYSNSQENLEQPQCSEFWNNQTVMVPTLYQVCSEEYNEVPVQNTIAHYTDNKEIFLLDNAMEDYIESEICTELENVSDTFNSRPDTHNGISVQDTERVMRDIENNIYNLDTTITYQLLDSDEFENNVVEDKNVVDEQHNALENILMNFPESMESSEGFATNDQTGEQKNSDYKDYTSAEYQTCHRKTISEDSDDSFNDVDLYSEVEVDDPNDQDYFPNEMELMIEMGFSSNIYNKISKRKEGYNLRPRGKSAHIKVKSIRELQNKLQHRSKKIIGVQKRRNKSDRKHRKFLYKIRNVIDTENNYPNNHNNLSDEDPSLTHKNQHMKNPINNDALKQLLSPGIRKSLKQHKTITFLGEDPKHGRTVQKIKVVDPTVKCVAENTKNDESNHNETKIDKPIDTTTKKKYQCGKCDKVFEELSSFKEHNKCTVENYKGSTKRGKKFQTDHDDFRYLCTQCGKTLKNHDKFEMHCRGHGDPEVECEVCHKVFATKATLRNHKRLHERPFWCDTCYKSFHDVDKLRKHEAKNYCTPKPEQNEKVDGNNEELDVHSQQHMNFETDIETTNHYDDNIEINDDVKVAGQLRDIQNTFEIKVLNEMGQIDTENYNFVPMESTALDVKEINIVSSNSNKISIENSNAPLVSESTSSCFDVSDENVKKANAMMAKVMETDIFLNDRTGKKSKYHNKVCNVCGKTFDRVGDLKRHLIEHVIRVNLLKNPVSKDGTLHLECEICQVETFTKIDKYKAHLREHAKLTLYQCKFCDKSFSDSSNFSKHKKVHGAPSFQCDLCQRKFNSKKMIAQHMEYHSNTEPILCQYCEKVFHFESSLKKHLKLTHNRNKTAQFRCKLCHQYFRSLKEKWDHEWVVHSVRKMVADCMFCDKKFRKYSELKRHYSNSHDTMICSVKK